MTNGPVLGKGLGSLIPNISDQRSSWGPTVQTVPEGERIVQIALNAIDANPWQPRSNFDQERLNELAASIREYGIIQPLVVTEGLQGRYQLVAGERRLKAAKLAGLATVPAVIRKLEDQKKLEVSLVENLQRHNLNPVEEALGYKRLMDEFNLTQEEVSVRVGRSRPTVANFLRLLSLPKAILEALVKEEITFSHAKVILSGKTEKEQLRTYRRIIREKLSVAAATAGTRPAAPGAADPVIASWEQKLTERMGFRSHIKKTPQGGVIEIHFKSDEDLKSLLDKLLMD